MASLTGTTVEQRGIMQQQFTIVQPTKNSSSACTLPLELLSEIFQAYLPPKQQGGLNIQNVSEVNLWRLGHVCSWWRVATTSTPHLWSVFTDRPTGLRGDTMPDLDESKHIRARLVSCLERSRPCSISFILVSADLALLPELTKESHRWEKVDLAPALGSTTFSSIFQGNLLNLRSLTTSFSYEFLPNLQAFNIFERAPKLSHLKFIRITIPHTYTAPTTLNHLTRLTLILSDIHPTGLLSLLSSTPNLIEFTLIGRAVQVGSQPVNTVSVILQQLRTLRLSYPYGECVWLLAYLMAPRLDTLSLYYSESLIKSLPTFFERSSIRGLSELILTGSTTAFLIDIIKGLRFVKRFVLQVMTDPRRFVHIASLGDYDSSLVLPEIDELCIPGHNFEWILKELESRHINHERLSLLGDGRDGFKLFYRDGRSMLLSNSAQNK